MTTNKQRSAIATLDDWKRQPARAFELIEAEAAGVSILELRERFLLLINAELTGVANDWIN